MGGDKFDDLFIAQTSPGLDGVLTVLFDAVVGFEYG